MISRLTNNNDINENDKYVEIIIDNIEQISNLELRKLILRLIEERNYLSTTIKIDPLTGLYNRRILNHIRNHDAAVMMDIDNFKKINDTFGHDVGDTVIQKIGQILKINTRISDYVCRMGGDEFLVVFTNCDKEIITARVDKILKQIENTIVLPNLTVTSSAGIAFNDNNSSIEETVKEADEALYESKNNEKNRVSIYQRKIKKIGK